MAFDGIQPKRNPFGFGSALGAFLKYLYSAILCTGKLISHMKANSRNPQNIPPAKYSILLYSLECC